MSEEPTFCTGCGRPLPVDWHHIAGAVYDSAMTPACSGSGGCHYYLTRRQLDNGIDLSRDTPKSTIDTDRARAMGLNDLVGLALRRRHAQMVPIVEAFDVATGLGSALLDISDDPGRAGRWLPDTIGARHRSALHCSPVDVAEDASLVATSQLIEAVASQGEAMFMEEVELAAMRRMANDIEALYKKFEHHLQGDDSIQPAWDQIPELMVRFALKLTTFLEAVFWAASNDTIEDDLPGLMAMAMELAPVTRAMNTFCVDAESASTAEECREVMLRLPRVLQASL